MTYTPLFLSTVLAAVLISLAPRARAEDEAAFAPVIETENGAVRGTLRPTTIAFFGIPFAKPPVGDLRWRPPESAARWHGVRDASKFGAHCPQPGTDPQPAASEDCLFLNVYVPAALGDEQDDSSRGLRRADRPVMVWIYGGANASGASDFYDPTPLVEAGGVVVVTVNYRIGALGFLAHPALNGGPASLPPPSQRLSLAMRAYWTNFARSSTPNASRHGEGEDDERKAALPAWPRAATAAGSIQLLVPPSPQTGAMADYSARHHCAFWN